MTGAATMIQFTPDAERRLGEYLRQVRSAGRRPGVSPDEIEADIREHIETEFHDRRPARSGWPSSRRCSSGSGRRRSGCRRTPPPGGWRCWPGRPGRSANGSGRPGGRILGVIWRGPEDWRLPYLAFGAFALGVVAFPLFPLFLLVSYVLARAGLAAAAEKGVTLGARRLAGLPADGDRERAAIAGRAVLGPSSPPGRVRRTSWRWPTGSGR